MDHRRASRLLPDFSRSLLSAADQLAVADHVQNCPECRDLDAFVRALVAGGRELEASLADQHPSDEDLVQFLLEQDPMDPDAAGSIAKHLEICPSCISFASMLRNATAHQATGRGLFGRISHLLEGGLKQVLLPAAAVAILLLIYPAYRGAVELPRILATARQEAAESASLGHRVELLERQIDARKSSAWRGGGAGILYLSGTLRGNESEVPQVTIKAGQPILPIVIDGQFGAPAPGRDVTFVLSRSAAPDAAIWQASLPLHEVVDAKVGTATILVPSDSLASGSYRIQVREPGAAQAWVVREFEIRRE